MIPNGIRIKPILKIQKDNMVFNVEISADSFCKDSKLAQNRSNIHFEWWNSEDQSESIVPPPTPLYNSLISQDLGREMEAEIYQDWTQNYLIYSFNGLKFRIDFESIFRKWKTSSSIFISTKTLYFVRDSNRT